MSFFQPIIREMLETGGTGSASSKEWWGPRIWRILHSLAELADRRDCMFLWKGVLRLTAEILPCDLCRTHFNNRIPSYHASATLQSEAVRDRIRDFVWSAHQDVNGRHAKAGIPREKLVEEYGVREGYSRSDITNTIVFLVEEINRRFADEHVLDRFHANIPIQWKREILNLLHICNLPEAPSQGPSQTPSNRRRRARPGSRM